MIKTPLSTVIGGAFWTPGATILGSASKTLNQLIKSLFANNEQGFAYDPNDLSTMYRDAAGIIPVTGAGQPLGLMLDKSKGLALSNELVTNGDFSNGLSGWSVQNGTSVIVNGAARVTATSTAQPQLYMPTAFLAGKRIEISVDFMNRTGGTGVFVGLYSVALGAVVSVTSNNASGVVKMQATIPLGFDGGLYCRLNSPTAGSYVDFDNVSIKEITGNHAYQTTSSMRPLLAASPQRLDYDTVDDKLTTTLPAQLTGCTVVRAVPNVGTQILTGQTIPATYEDNKDHCGLIVINRALTATETSQITKLFNKAAGV